MIYLIKMHIKLYLLEINKLENIQLLIDILISNFNNNKMFKK